MLLILGMYFVIGSEGPESWLLTGDRFWLLPLKFSQSGIVFLHGAINIVWKGGKYCPMSAVNVITPLNGDQVLKLISSSF